MTKLTNPYAREKVTRTLMVDVSEADYYLIKNLRPEQGTMSGVLGTLWKKLCDQLREMDYCDYTSKREFEEFVVNCRIVEGTGHIDER